MYICKKTGQKNSSSPGSSRNAPLSSPGLPTLPPGTSCPLNAGCLGPTAPRWLSGAATCSPCRSSGQSWLAPWQPVWPVWLGGANLSGLSGLD